MVKRGQVRIIVLLAMAVAAGFLGLGYRLVQLQVLRHEQMSVRAQSSLVRERLFEPRRGDILDVKGNALATTEYRKAVWADPSIIENWHTPLAQTIAPILQLDALEVEGKLRQRLRADTGRIIKYVNLKDYVTLEDWQRVQEAVRALEQQLLVTEGAQKKSALAQMRRGIGASDQPLRVYPQKNLASHIVGFAKTEQRKVAELEASDAETPAVYQVNGRDGIELVLDQKLVGAHGWRVTEYARRNRQSVELVSQRKNDVPARDGLNVYLTVDTYIQDLLERALHEAMQKHIPLNASGVIVRPSTGEILAMACIPDYDPNNLNAVTLDVLRNKVISDVIEPGSTFKIVVTAGALNERVVTLRDRFDCEQGRFFYGGHPLRDHHAYPILSVEEIITKSSNIGAAKIGIRLGEQRLYDYIRAFGFGSRTGIPLLGEVGGIVPPVSKWWKVTLAQIPMGHGIAVTRLQMVMAMGAIANEGQLMRPMLVDRLEDRDHNVIAKYTPQRVGQIIREDAARDMVQALKTVVGPEGTAPRAALENYTVAGKTGTAQKVEGRGYSNERFFASFIGFFPADNPEVCIGIFLDEPRNRKYGYYGGSVVGPIFKQVAEGVAKYLSIPPDRPQTNDLRIVSTGLGPNPLSQREP